MKPLQPFVSNFNPQMDEWYRLGAAIIHPSNQSAP